MQSSLVKLGRRDYQRRLVIMLISRARNNPGLDDLTFVGVGVGESWIQSVSGNAQRRRPAEWLAYRRR